MNQITKDQSTFKEGFIAWLLLNICSILVPVYLLYLHTNKGRIWEKPFGFLGNKSGITFIVLFIFGIPIEIGIIIIIKYLIGQ